jgi:SAM-dependent methyltransferase
LGNANVSQFDDWAAIYDRVYAYLKHDISFYVEEAVLSGGPVLELGCGTGRISIPIARANIDVVGVDISRDLIAVARRKAKGLDIERSPTFKVGDMRTVNLKRRFSLVIMPFRVFQMMLSIPDQFDALQRVREHLVQGGRFILDIFAPDVRMLADDSNQPFHFRDVHDPSTGHVLSLWHQDRWDHLHQINNARLKVDERNKENNVIGEFVREFQIRCIYRYEMQHLLSLCGFRLVELYGGFDRRPFDDVSEDMVWVTEAR